MAIVTTDTHDPEAGYARQALDQADRLLSPYERDGGMDALRYSEPADQIAAAQAFATMALARATIAVHDKLAEMLDHQVTTNEHLEAIARAQLGAF